jgi:hypothetical protein
MIIIPGQGGTYRHSRGRVTHLLAESGLMPASVLRVGRTLALLRDRYGSTDGRTARDIGPGGNQLGNQPENHAADLREDTHQAPDLLPPRKSQAQDAT